MITVQEYEQAKKQQEDAEKIIHQFFKEKQETFNQRMKENHIFTDDELVYSAIKLCPCGHGLAYPKDCGPQHYWDCSAILKGIAEPGKDTHTAQLPFMFYDIKSESEHRGTTRGVFRSKPRTDNA